MVKLTTFYKFACASNLTLGKLLYYTITLLLKLFSVSAFGTKLWLKHKVLK